MDKSMMHQARITKDCSIEGCRRSVLARGWCGTHYWRWHKYGDPMRGGQIRERVDEEERFWSKVDRRADDECWPWKGTMHVSGYGYFRAGGEAVSATLAHRYMYELTMGEIPEGMTLDHVWARGCKRTDCVNPSHLEPVTNKVNILRGDSVPAKNARKTHCIRGHEFSIENTRKTPHGHRTCRACHRLREQARRGRKSVTSNGS